MVKLLNNTPRSTALQRLELLDGETDATTILSTLKGDIDISLITDGVRGPHGLQDERPERPEQSTAENRDLGAESHAKYPNAHQGYTAPHAGELAARESQQRIAPTQSRTVDFSSSFVEEQVPVTTCGSADGFSDDIFDGLDISLWTTTPTID